MNKYKQTLKKIYHIVCQNTCSVSEWQQREDEIINEIEQVVDPWEDDKFNELKEHRKQELEYIRVSLVCILANEQNAQQSHKITQLINTIKMWQNIDLPLGRKD